MTNKPRFRKNTLPPPNTQRWVKSRKLAVIQAIEEGELTDETACQRYDISPEELESWKRLTKRYGPQALRTTHLKEYREHDTNFLLLD
jgi:transposase-like protein